VIAMCAGQRIRDKARQRTWNASESSEEFERLRQRDKRSRARTCGDCTGTRRRRHIARTALSPQTDAFSYAVASTQFRFVRRGNGRWS
jgi:hypothetical protein